MFTTILNYEVCLFLRSKGMLIAWILFLLTGIFCLQQGYSTYTYQRVAQDSAFTKSARNLQRIQTMLDTTTVVAGKRNSFEAPYYLDWLEGKIAAKYLSPISALSVGQNDVYPQLKSGRFSGNIFSNDFSEFKNPDRLLAGNLDASFFVLFLFPLLLIALTFDLRSSDREKGILPLLQAQATSLKKVYTFRLLVRWGIAILPVLLLSLASLVVLYKQPGFEGGDFIVWWGIALLYCLFWLSLTAFVQRLSWHSVINCIALCGAWVLLLIALPGIMNTWYSYEYPDTYKLESAEFRDESYKLWDLPMSEHKAVFLKQYPQLRDSLFRIDSNDIKSYSYAAMALQQERNLYQKSLIAPVAQNKAEENAFWINPVGGVLRAMAALGGATLSQQHAFEQAVLDYRTKKMQYLFDNQLLEQNFTSDDLAALPKFEQSVRGMDGWGRRLAPLVVLMLFLTIAGTDLNRPATTTKNK